MPDSLTLTLNGATDACEFTIVEHPYYAAPPYYTAASTVVTPIVSKYTLSAGYTFTMKPNTYRVAVNSISDSCPSCQTQTTVPKYFPFFTVANYLVTSSVSLMSISTSHAVVPNGIWITDGFTVNNDPTNIDTFHAPNSTYGTSGHVFYVSVSNSADTFNYHVTIDDNTSVKSYYVSGSAGVHQIVGTPIDWSGDPKIRIFITN